MRCDWYWLVRNLREEPIWVKITDRIIDDETNKVIMVYAVDKTGKQYRAPANWFTYRKPIVYT